MATVWDREHAPAATNWEKPFLRPKSPGLNNETGVGCLGVGVGAGVHYGALVWYSIVVGAVLAAKILCTSCAAAKGLKCLGYLGTPLEEGLRVLILHRPRPLHVAQDRLRCQCRPSPTRAIRFLWRSGAGGPFPDRRSLRDRQNIKAVSAARPRPRTEC